MTDRKKAAQGVTMQVAEWVANLKPEDVPESTRRFLRHAVLDTFGCGLQGRSQPWTEIAEGWVRAGGGSGVSSVWGDNTASMRPSDAALVNGVATHAFELDDFHQTKQHPGAVVVPAALAVGESVDASGEMLMTAIAAGYEVMIRSAAAIGAADAKARGWHITGICGTFGAAAAAAVLMRLNPEQTAWALGLAGTQSSGLFAFTADGAMSKRLHAGQAARSGVAAAELAAAGFTGPTQIYEAVDGGFLWTFTDAGNHAPLIEGLGKVWRQETTSFKPHAACGSTHSYIDAGIELHDRYPDLTGRRVRVGQCRLVDEQCGFDYVPGTVLNAQMSMRFCVAASLRYGQALPGEFSTDRLSEPATVELAQRIELVHDAEMDDIYPSHYPGWVEVERVPGSGEFDRAHRDDPSGSIANPNKEAVMIEKFHRLMKGILTEDQAIRLESLAMSLEDTSARDFVAALAYPARAAAE
ncbi:MAG: MmgE/PrpD family protein [Proteobacteria bacterium]|nr:MmgE/PrpD family protein [Pseudomonadota bacterium]